MKLTDYDCFCVYEHVDPRTKKPRYVGMGAPARAYGFADSSRSQEHQDWIEELVQEGHSLWDIVKIKHKDLPKTAALEAERSLIEKYTERKESLFNVYFHNTESLCKTPTEDQIYNKAVAKSFASEKYQFVDGRKRKSSGAKQYKTRCWN